MPRYFGVCSWYPSGYLKKVIPTYTGRAAAHPYNRADMVFFGLSFPYLPNIHILIQALEVQSLGQRPTGSSSKSGGQSIAMTFGGGGKFYIVPQTTGPCLVSGACNGILALTTHVFLCSSSTPSSFRKDDPHELIIGAPQSPKNTIITMMYCAGAR